MQPVQPTRGFESHVRTRTDKSLYRGIRCYSHPEGRYDLHLQALVQELRRRKRA